jgi:flagellar basal body-associated protein FliL
MMDFGPTEGQAKKEKKKTGPSKWTVIFGAVVFLVVAAVLIVFLLGRDKNPIPPSVKSQLSFRPAYPSSSTSNSTNFKYQADQKALIYNYNFNGTNIVFTEQSAPSTVGSGSQVYYQALGLHPYAQFVSKLGPVALVKFYNPGTLTPAGESGIMATSGTLVIAHADKDLTNEQWQALFNSLKIAG